MILDFLVLELCAHMCLVLVLVPGEMYDMHEILALGGGGKVSWAGFVTRQRQFGVSMGNVRRSAVAWVKVHGEGSDLAAVSMEFEI